MVISTPKKNVSLPDSLFDEISETIGDFRLGPDCVFDAVAEYGLVEGVQIVAKERIFLSLVDVMNDFNLSYNTIDTITDHVYEASEGQYIHDVIADMKKEYS